MIRSKYGTHLLGLLGALLLASAMLGIAPPASAQQANHVFSQEGVTARWSDDTYQDLRVVATPHATDTASSSADAYVGGEIIKAWKASNATIKRNHADSRAGGVSILAAPNGCSFSPDSWGKANFKPACDWHDTCYSSSSKASRYSCDASFLSQLYVQCHNAYGSSGLKASACKAVSKTYYAAVRAAGKSAYKGKGNPA